MAGKGSGVELAAAYMTIIPTLKGMQGKLAEELIPESKKASEEAGEQLKIGLMGKIKGLKAAIAGSAIFAGLGASAKYLYGVGKEFRESYDTIRAGTGATGKAMEGLKGVFRNVAAEVPADFKSISAVVADLNTTLGYSGPQLEKVSKQILEMGRLTGAAVNIRDMSSSLSSFQVPAEKASAALDDIFRISQATGVPVNELTAQLKTQGGILKTVGFDFKNSAALLGVLQKSGVNASTVINSMGPGLVRLARAGEKPPEAFKRIVSEIGNFVKAGDQASALKLAANLFGTRGATQFVAAMESGKISMQDMVKAAGVSKDTILGLGEETRDAAESWQIMKNNVQLALEPLGSAVFGAVSDALGAMLGPLKAVGAFMQQHQTTTKIIAAGIAAVTVALGALAIAMGIAALASSALTLATSPITLTILGVMAAIAAAAAIGYYLYENWNTIVSYITGVFNPVLDTLKSAWQSVKDTLVAVWGAIKQAFFVVFEAVKTLIVGYATFWVTVFTTAWNTVKTVVTAVFTAIRAAISTYINVWSTIINAGLTVIKGIFQAAWQLINGDFRGAWATLKAAVSAGISSVLGLVRGIPGGIRSALSNVGSLLWSAGSAIMTSLWNGLKAAWGKVTNFVGGIASWIKSHKGPESYDRQLLVENGGWIMDGLSRGLRKSIPQLRETLSDITGEISDTQFRLPEVDVARSRLAAFAARTAQTVAVSAYQASQPATAETPRAITVNQYIQSAEVPRDSELASAGAAQARLIGAI